MDDDGVSISFNILSMPVLLLAVPLLVLWAVASASKRTAENIARLAGELGLQLESKPPVLGWFYPQPKVFGEIRGKRVEVFTYFTGSGKSRTRWCAVSAAVRVDAGLTLALRRQGVGTKVMELFGSREIQVGDPPFDAAWFVQTNQPEFLQAALVPELRASLVSFAQQGAAQGARFEVERGLARYSEQGTFASPALCTRIGAATATVIDLADVAEVFAAEKK